MAGPPCGLGLGSVSGNGRATERDIQSPCPLQRNARTSAFSIKPGGVDFNQAAAALAKLLVPWVPTLLELVLSPPFLEIRGIFFVTSLAAPVISTFIRLGDAQEPCDGCRSSSSLSSSPPPLPPPPLPPLPCTGCSSSSLSSSPPPPPCTGCASSSPPRLDEDDEDAPAPTVETETSPAPTPATVARTAALAAPTAAPNRFRSAELDRHGAAPGTLGTAAAATVSGGGGGGGGGGGATGGATGGADPIVEADADAVAATAACCGARGATGCSVPSARARASARWPLNSAMHSGWQ